MLPTPAGLFSLSGGYDPQQIWDDLYAGLRAETMKEADRLVKQAVDVVKAAADLKADLLVLGTHGRTGVAQLFLGSVATRVVAAAPCPVLTVRAPGA